MTTPETVTIIGNPVSPYVRKVLVCLNVKGVPFRLDPIVPFLGNDEFSRLSPLRRVPVFMDSDVTLTDSSVICQYLEDKFPRAPLFPENIAVRAHARWLEEFADTRLGDVFVWKLFNQAVLQPAIWGTPRNDEVIAKTLQDDVPPCLDYLESQMREGGFLCGDFSIADIAVASFFRNAAFARFTPDAARWPRTAAWLGRAFSHPAFAALADVEIACLKTPPQEQRAMLSARGVALTATTMLTDKPRRGVSLQ